MDKKKTITIVLKVPAKEPDLRRALHDLKSTIVRHADEFSLKVVDTEEEEDKT